MRTITHPPGLASCPSREKDELKSGPPSGETTSAPSGWACGSRPRPVRQPVSAHARLSSDLAAAQRGREAGRSSGKSGASTASGAVSNEQRGTCTTDPILLRAPSHSSPGAR